ARGILGNPWLFAEIKAAINNESYSPPSAAEKINVAIEHTRSVINEKGEGAVAAAKGQLAWYVKGIRGAADARNRIMSADTFSEMEKILLEVAKNTHEV
ncbi:MAG: tRNA-dihydrouridine synthase, partial [Ruminococcaceae bacterium]|nr:tRNA-dihydrouridine synthase [Oscillospiraceae bacterium]